MILVFQRAWHCGLDWGLGFSIRPLRFEASSQSSSVQELSFSPLAAHLWQEVSEFSCLLGRVLQTLKGVLSGARWPTNKINSEVFMVGWHFVVARRHYFWSDLLIFLMDSLLVQQHLAAYKLTQAQHLGSDGWILPLGFCRACLWTGDHCAACPLLVRLPVKLCLNSKAHCPAEIEIAWNSGTNSHLPCKYSELNWTRLSERDLSCLCFERVAGPRSPRSPLQPDLFYDSMKIKKGKNFLSAGSSAFSLSACSPEP